MTTIIDHNGSKWAGEKPDPLSALYKMLETTPLRREFVFADAPEEWSFINKQPICTGQSFMTKDGRCYPASKEQPYIGMTQFSGNFHRYNHPFSVYTNDPKKIKKLTQLIRENIQRADYQELPKPDSTMGHHYILMSNGDHLFFENGEYIKRDVEPETLEQEA